MSDPKPQTEPTMEEILNTVRRLIAEDESGPAAAAPIADGDVLELTEALQPDGSVRHLPPFSGSPRSPEKISAPAASDGRIEPVPPSAASPEPIREADEPAAIAVSGEPREPTIGVAAAGAAPAEGAARTEPRLGADRTLEDIVREVLRPMVQNWLDENLPGLVEREVQAAVARSAREAAGAEPQPPRRRPRRSGPL